MEQGIKLTKFTNGGYASPIHCESNLELFRIITMLLIVAHHYVVNSGLMAEDGSVLASPMSVHSIFLLMFGAWWKIGINCFVMITGYFMCKSKITAKKFAKLIGEWFFYRYLIHFIFIITGYEILSLKNCIKILIPITQIAQNFTSCFVIFWLFIPFLNKLIVNMTERQHIYLLILTGFTYIFIGTAHKVTMNYVTWFMVLYFIASYIRLHTKKWMNSKKICDIMLILSIVVSAMSVIVCAKTGHSAFMFVTDSNTFLAVTVGIFAFLFFRNIKIPYSKFINTIATSTFGVLLIHAHSDAMRQWLWKDIIDTVGHYNDKFMPFYAIECVVGIFVICILIDIVPINLIEKPFFQWWDKHWDSLAKGFQESENKLLKKLNAERNGHKNERNYPRRRFRHKTIPNHKGDIETITSDLR